MKTTPGYAPYEPSESDIREYAYHLYCQGGCVPGHDLDNWLEAESCLRAEIPQNRSRQRLHHHIQGQARSKGSVPAAA
jgi:hypothetical protein